MKIALLHYWFWPEFGGVNNLLRDQAITLLRQGHEVLVMTGKGDDPGDGYAFAHIEQLAEDYPLNKDVRAVLERGQVDQAFFNKYRQELVDALRVYLAEVDVTFVHNVFTMHFNLPLTVALLDLAKEFKVVAWTHDLAANSLDYSLPNPTKQPWSIVRMSFPHVRYVAVSEARRDEMEATLQPKPEVLVVPNLIDIGRMFDFTLEIRESLEALSLAERDFVFLLPARMSVRKNIEFAIEIIKTLREQKRNPLLLITGAPDPHSYAAQQYAKFLRDTMPDRLRRYVVFVNDFFPVQDPMMRDLYEIADCLLFPSKQEGFGMPILEAALHRIPIWCNNVPAFWSTEGEGAFMINNIGQLNDAVSWLESQPTFRLQRLVRHHFDSMRIYKRHYIPLLKEYGDPEAARANVTGGMQPITATGAVSPQS